MEWEKPLKRIRVGSAAELLPEGKFKTILLDYQNQIWI
jgi:hypothetical protein